MPALGRGASPGQGPGPNRLLSLLTTGATQLTGAKSERKRYLLSPVRLCVRPGPVAHQAPLFMEFSRQGHWGGWLFHPPGHRPSPGIKPASLQSPALAGRFFTL